MNAMSAACFMLTVAALLSAFLARLTTISKGDARWLLTVLAPILRRVRETFSDRFL